MKKTCPKCKVELKIGQYIDFNDPEIRSEYFRYSKGKLILCYKCPKCGYSEK